MKNNPDIHHRRSIRLRQYDFSSAGAYFVTICTQGRECLFGEVVDEEMNLNDAGRQVSEWWLKSPGKFPAVALDEYMIMPNHFHGVVVLVGADPRVRPDYGAVENAGGHMGPPLQRVVQWFKTMTTNAYIRGVNEHGWLPFPGRLWQRNYYERVIRDERELDTARKYIQENPIKWHLDRENPQNATPTP